MRIMFNKIDEEGTEAVPAVMEASLFEYDPEDNTISIYDIAYCWYTVNEVDYSSYLAYSRELYRTGMLDLTGTDLLFEADDYEE